ncbi:MAG: endonuclease/exonuclease/phosphatase family protein [Zoogloeaceae bacterium]|jgi:endonuclease/exonuclease/phosphatase (EEP) superfamily protein YafD|nr:endonuclease/exonuclease/phosphatase family protein [Zoogloeaceae bacterium]
MPSPILRAFACRWLCFVAVAMLLGLMGRWHWGADLFSHFVVQYALLLLLLTGLLFWHRAGHWRWAALALSLSLWGFIALSLWLPIDSADSPVAQTRLNFLQFNARQNTAVLTRWLLQHQNDETRMDVVLVLEAPVAFAVEMETLAEVFPYRLAQLEDSPFGIALMSRHPLVGARILDVIGTEFPVVTAQLVLPEGRQVMLFGIHPPPPVGSDLAELHTQFMDALALQIDPAVPTVVFGDFNATPWSPRLQVFMTQTGLYDAQQGFGLSGTWPAFTARYADFLGIPIDLTLVSNDLRIHTRRTGPDWGSDHLPVMTGASIRK